jgi:hypothetical protein
MLSDDLLLAKVRSIRIGNAVDEVICSGPLRGSLWRRICMYDALSFAEMEGQHLELLPARTVMSMFTADGCGGCGGDGDGGSGGNGGNGQGGIGINVLSGIGILGTGVASAGNGVGGAGGNA